MDVNGIRQALRCGRSGCECATGRNVHCPLPLHKRLDRDPSLTVDIRGDRILLNCKRGCSQEQVLAELAVRKLWPPDQAPASRAPVTTSDRRRPRALTCEWTYRDAAGTAIAVHGRFDFTDVDGGKEFLWRLEGNERWTGLHGRSISELPLYNVDLLADEPEAPVYICEGEKAADACMEHGLLAVSPGGGASQKDFGTSLEVLRGRTVILWPDNDDAGATLMSRVLALIPDAMVLNVPGLPEKGDAWDYFAAGGSVARLEELTVRPEPVVRMDDDLIEVDIPQPGGNVLFAFTDLHTPNNRDLFANVDVSPTLPGIRPGPYGAHLNVKSISNIETFRRQLDTLFTNEPGWTALLDTAIRLVKARYGTASFAVDLDQVPLDWTEEYVIHGICPFEEMTILFAKGGTGKTYVALHMAAHLLTGEPWLARTTKRVRAVLYVDYESNAKVIRRRFQRIIDGMGVEYTGGFHYYGAKGIPFAQQLPKIKAEAKRVGADVIFIDSAGAACGGRPEDADIALGMFNAIQSIGLTTILISHVTKNGDETMPFGCHDEETEVLTDRGWMRHADLAGDELVASFNAESHDLRWERPSAHHAYPFDGDLLSLGGRSYEAFVTENHRMLAAAAYKGATAAWEWTTAGALNGTTMFLPHASGRADGDGLPASLDFMAFLGWWISEGHLDGNAPLLTQVEGPLASRMLDTVQRLGFETSIVKPVPPVSNYQQCWQIRAKGASELGRWLRAECGAGAANKHLPEVVWSLDRAALRALLDALMEGDGHWRAPGRSGTYSTTSQRLADDVQRLAILAGFGANVTPRKPQVGWLPQYTVKLHARRRIEFRAARHLQRLPYVGTVYCLTVPSGAYVTRRNGHMAVTGNSAYWHNAARATWFMKGASTPGANTIDVGVFNRKMSDDADQPPFGIEIHFDGKTGPVTVTEQRIHSSLRPEKKMKDYIYETLENAGRPMSVWEIATSLQFEGVLEIDEGEDATKKFEQQTGVLRSLLNRYRAGSDNKSTSHAEQLFVRIGTGTEGTWALLIDR